MLNGTHAQSNPPRNGHAPIAFNGHAHPVAVPNRPGPHNLELEEAFFGAAFNDNSVLEQVPFLEPQHFYEPLHQRIFEVMATLFRSGKDVSAITLKAFFENDRPILPNMTVPQYLVRLYANATTIINAGEYARTIRELADRRSAIVICEGLVARSFDEPDTPTPELIREAKGLLSDVEAASDGNGWPTPDVVVLQRGQEVAPEMPLDGFGEPLETYIRDAAAASGSPIDYVALAVLTGGAGLIGSRRYVRIWSDWREPAILWVALVGEPSTNKSPSIDPTRAALNAVEAEKLEAYEPKEAEYKEAAMMAKAVKRSWEKAVEAAVTKNKPIPELPSEARDPERPVRPRTWIANATTEKLARLLAEQPGGIINFCDELSGLIGSFDRYGGNGGDRAFWLELFGGRPYRLDRVADGSIDIPHAAVSLLGTIQPDRLSRLVLSGDNDGFASRFLYAWPKPRAKCRPSVNPDGTVLRRAFKRLGFLDSSDAIDIPLDDAAASVFQSWWTGPHDAATKDASGLLAEAYAKLDGVVPRIALVLEYLRWASAPQWLGEPEHVSCSSIEAAIAVADLWAKPMYRRVFAEASVPEEDRNAAVLARYLLAAQPNRINARQLRLTKKSALPGIRDARSMDQACDSLCEAGWLRASFTRAGGAKGRKAKNYDVNPHLAKICIAPHSTSSVSPDSPPNGAKGAIEVTPYINSEAYRHEVEGSPDG